MPDLSPYRKTVVAVLSFALTALSALLGAGLVIPESWVPWINAVVVLAAAYGVYAVPNRPLDDEPGKHEAGDQ